MVTWPTICTSRCTWSLVIIARSLHSVILHEGFPLLPALALYFKASVSLSVQTQTHTHTVISIQYVISASGDAWAGEIDGIASVQNKRALALTPVFRWLICLISFKRRNGVGGVFWGFRRLTNIYRHSPLHNDPFSYFGKRKTNFQSQVFFPVVLFQYE